MVLVKTFVIIIVTDYRILLVYDTVKSINFSAVSAYAHTELKNMLKHQNMISIASREKLRNI